MFEITPHVQALFWMNVEKADSCWLWKGSLTKSGYGRFNFEYKCYRAHRVSYYLLKGAISSKMFICHSCDNQKCVNPAHLWEGTPQDNTLDMVKKDRRKSPGKHKKSSSIYHGVHYFEEPENKKKWRCVVTHNYKQKRIGRFLTELESAQAYDKFVKKLNYFLPINRKKLLNFPE